MTHYPTIDMVKTGQNIARLRKQAGLSVKEADLNLVVLAAIFQVHIEDILVIDQGLRAA